MKIKVKKFYGICTTRGRARKLREKILALLSGNEKRLIIDFTDIKVVSMSFLDELIVNSLSQGIFTNLSIDIVSPSPNTGRYIQEASHIRQVKIDNVSTTTIESKNVLVR